MDRIASSNQPHDTLFTVCGTETILTNHDQLIQKNETNNIKSAKLCISSTKFQQGMKFLTMANREWKKKVFLHSANKNRIRPEVIDR